VISLSFEESISVTVLLRVILRSFARASAIWLYPEGKILSSPSNCSFSSKYLADNSLGSPALS
jgi:hypothetical protein